jgi:pilus assembly protein CpaB
MKKAGLIASLVAALGSGGLAHLYFMRLEAEVSGGPRIPVLVAATDVPVGTPLSESALVVRDIPQAYVEGRQVRASEVKKVLGARVAAGLKANEALLWSDLSRFNDHARVLSGLIENGMRAVAVDGRTASFDGLLRPGDRVDVLLTTGDKDSANTATVTLLQDLLVLSVGGSIARADQDPKGPGRGTSVSVSATVEQAQLLTLSTEHGRLTLTLRNPDDILLVEDVPAATPKDLDPRTARTEAVRDLVTQKERIEHVR